MENITFASILIEKSFELMEMHTQSIRMALKMMEVHAHGIKSAPKGKHIGKCTVSEKHKQQDCPKPVEFSAAPLLLSQCTAFAIDTLICYVLCALAHASCFLTVLVLRSMFAHVLVLTQSWEGGCGL